jgi:predicted transcriptional regulator
MPQSVLEMAKDLVITQIRTDHMSPEDVQESTRHIFESLLVLKSREEAESPGAAAAPGTAPAPSDWRQSITQHAITCLECGAQFRQLNGRHLRLHGLDARTYRLKYGIPATQPLAARVTAAKRRKIVTETKPWEKSPTYRKGQQEIAATAKKAGRKKGTRQ